MIVRCVVCGSSMKYYPDEKVYICTNIECRHVTNVSGFADVTNRGAERAEKEA